MIEVIIVITFNLAGANLAVPREPVIAQTVRLVQRSHIVMAQEVTPTIFKKVNRDLRISGHLRDACLVERMKVNGRIIGHAVWSRWPIRKCSAKKWRRGRNGMVQFVTIQTPRRAFTVANFHAAPLKADWAYQKLIESNAADAYFLGGDFNMWIPNGMPYVGGSVNLKYHKTGGAIDHIITPCIGEARVLRNYDASDHYPVQALIERC